MVISTDQFFHEKASPWQGYFLNPALRYTGYTAAVKGSRIQGHQPPGSTESALEWLEHALQDFSAPPQVYYILAFKAASQRCFVI